MSTVSVVGVVLDDLGRRRCGRPPCPGVDRDVARRPRSSPGRSGGASARRSPASMSSASIFMPRTRLSPLEATRLAEELRIGEDEVRRRERVGDLLARRSSPCGGCARRARRRRSTRSLGPARGDEIGLLEEVEERVLRPFGVLEALVARLGLGDRVGASSPLHALQRRAPERRDSLPSSRVCASSARGGSDSQYSATLEKVLTMSVIGSATVSRRSPALARLDPGGRAPCRACSTMRATFSAKCSGSLTQVLLDVLGAFAGVVPCPRLGLALRHVPRRSSSTAFS